MNPSSVLKFDRVADDERWAAVVSRDRRADGTFVYSVKTTGIYCRPSCPSRRPLRNHVTFHPSCVEAEAAGFRACKRCQPRSAPVYETQAAMVTKACRAIENAEEPLDLTTLASAVGGLSRFHFHRVFKAITGLTPKAYAQAHRADRVREQLVGGRTVTEAIYGAGYNSSGRFYAESTQRLGMTPSVFRAGGEGESIRFAVGACSLGSILVAASAKGICAITLGDDANGLVQDLQDRFPKARLEGGEPGFERFVAKVVGAVESPGIGLDLPLDVRGTVFQQRVWEALQKVPVGTTVSYAALAVSIGLPRAVRAVAGACAANPLAVVIPCHRVVRTDGQLSGYRWGVERKRALLRREAGA